MAETPPERFEVTSIIIDRFKLKQPSFIPLLPDEFFPAIGKVAVMWGHLETIFEGLLTALADAEGLKEADWRFLNFRKKRTKLRELWETHLSPLCPQITQHLDLLLGELDAPYQRRNLAVHGQMMIEFGAVDGKGVAKLVCTGRYNGKQLKESFTANDLDDLFYQIANLTGRLTLIAQGHPWKFSTSTPEKSFLQDFLSKHHPTFPNPATLPRPPRS
jgi:hypothetical protein